MRDWGRVWLGLFWRLIGSVGVGTKIMGIVLGLVLLLGVGVTVQVRATMAQVLRREMEERGISIARDLAARSTDLILTNDLFGLHELLRDTTTNNDDLRYAFVRDAEGRTLVHSFTKGVPSDLLTINPVQADERYRIQILDTEEGLVHDVGVPIFGGRAGTARVGISEERLQAQMADITRQLLVTTFIVSLVGVIGGYLLTWVLTRPVRALVKVTQAVARGDLTLRAPTWVDDEIGTLGASVNSMLTELARAREELEDNNRRLLRRNRELSAVNAIAQFVSGPLDLGQAMERALEQVLSVIASDVGWICLLEGDGSCRAFAGMSGPFHPSSLDEFCICRLHCVCQQAVETGRPAMTERLTPDCPLRTVNVMEKRPITGHVSVPLSVKDQVVGLLNVACHEESAFQREDLELLGAMGRQLGVAMENTRLWEEVRRKEALRGQLLGKVISAQEEERKRIARELHDETGQSLTSLLVGLKVVETFDDMDQVRYRLGELKSTVAATVEAVHDLSMELRPSLLDDLGLVPALQRYVKDYSRRFGMAADFQAVSLDGQRFAPEIEITLYRIIQEAMTNAARHAAAGRVSVLLESRPTSVLAIVEDDGDGFDLHGVLGTEMRDRLGLYGMEERAMLVGGRLTIESTPKTGTTVFVEVPL